MTREWLDGERTILRETDGFHGMAVMRADYAALLDVAEAALAVDAEVSCADVRMDAPPSYYLPRRERSRDALIRLRAALGRLP